MTVTRTLRLDADLDEALKRIAETQGESVNFVAAKALRRMVEWDEHAEKFGMVTVTPEILTRLMDGYTVEQAREMGRWVGRDILLPYTQYLFPKLDLGSLSGSLGLLARYAARFTFDSSSAEGKTHWLFRHSLGLKWSEFYGVAVAEAIWGAGGVRAKVSISEDSCEAEFPTPKPARGSDR